MSQESDAFAGLVSNLTREKGQIVPFITKLQTDLVEANAKTAAAIAAGATDKEIADVARAAQPAIAQVVADLDQFTPEGTPVVQ